MNRALDITGDDIESWSHQAEAPDLLPDLVRRLLCASSPLSSIAMNAHGGTGLRGYDGLVMASEQTCFCPAGVSVWELTVQSDTEKLTKDYNTRTQAPGAAVPSETTYVAVSARRVGSKASWIAGRNAERRWKEVRLYHADDLATWLTQAPSVAWWFALLLNRPVTDLADIEPFLEDWRRRTRPALPIAICLAGEKRERLADEVRAWARSARPGDPIFRLHGDTREEAVVFAAAALALDESPEGQQIRTRTVIASSEQAMKWAIRHGGPQPLFVIADLEHPPASAGTVILPLEGPLPAGASDVRSLEPAPYLRFAEILEKHCGLPAAEATRVATASGGMLSSLQRVLGYVALPRWVEGAPSIVPLAVMLLAGAFEPQHEGDRRALVSLGADALQVESLCERLVLGPDPPVWKDDGSWSRAGWTWSALGDAWKALSGTIPAEVLRRFETTLRVVLGERDPGLDLPIEQRFAAALQGKALGTSKRLREGLVRSLVYLSLNDQALARLHGPKAGSSLANSAVRDLLTTPWQAWASLSGLLPLLSEAAPDTFLECLEASVREGDAGAMHLLTQESRFGDCPHTGLLWALENLGWDDRLMRRVASVLAKLAREDTRWDRPGRMANRPASSLRGLLHIVLPQTLASADQRIAEMRRGLDETPDVSFPLLVGLVGSQGPSVLFPAHEPELRPIAIPSRKEQWTRNRTDRDRVAQSYTVLVFEHAGRDAARWAYLLEHGRFHGSLATTALDRLEALKDEIRDEQARLWSAIRHCLHWTSTSDATDAVIFRRWHQLYEAYEPGDFALRHAWKFSPRAELPESSDTRGNYEAEWQRLDELRAAAIEELALRDDRMAVLVALVEQGVDSYLLGTALGGATFARELDSQLLDAAPQASLVPLVAYFLARRWNAEGNEWAERRCLSMLAQGRRSEVEATLLAFRANSKVWAMVDVLGEEIQHAYWGRLEYMLGEYSTADWERGIRSFLQAGNVAGAVRNAHWAKENLSLETTAEVLKALVSAPEDNATAFHRDPASSYNLEQLMDRLEKAPDAESRFGELLTKLELFHAVASHETTRPTLRLSAALAADAHDFVELVKRMDSPRGETAASLPVEEQEEARHMRELSDNVLQAWQGYPGEGLDPPERDHVLCDWSTEALRALVRAGRPNTGASEVARVLARASEGDDGHWPCLAARTLLESGEFPGLSSALILAKWNLRGMTTRSLCEGGRQERELAEGHRCAASTLRTNRPRTADMLDGLADCYERDAIRQDGVALATLRREGAEARDFERASPSSSSPGADTE